MPRAGFPPTDGPDTYTARHAVPAVVEEGGAGDQRGVAATGRWWCWRTCPASTARRSRCATCSWSTAPRSAGRSSTSTARSCSCVISPLPRRRVRGVLQAAQREHDGAGARGLVRLGDRRRPGGGGGVRRRRRQAHRRRPAGRRRWRRGSRQAAPAPSGPSCSWSWPTSGRRCAPRRSARSRPSSTASTTSTAPCEVGSVDGVISAAELRPRDHRGDRGVPGARGAALSRASGRSATLGA